MSDPYVYKQGYYPRSLPWSRVEDALVDYFHKHMLGWWLDQGRNTGDKLAVMDKTEINLTTLAKSMADELNRGRS